MNLGFKKKFDNGSLTNFERKIAGGLLANWDAISIPTDDIEKTNKFSTQWNDLTIEDNKIHSIRSGDRWRTGMLVHMATGIRTKYYKCFAKVVCQSVQNIEICFLNDGQVRIVYVDNIEVFDFMELVENDGLTLKQFQEWFFKSSVYDSNYGGQMFRGQIIHWTNKKY